jgi:cardiolipin synthase
MAMTLPSFGEIYFGLDWAIRLAMLGIVPFRRSPAATRSWLLLIFFLPLPGLLLYLAIGRPRFPRWRGQRFAQVEPTIAGLSARLDQGASGCAALYADAAALARQLGGLPSVTGNTIELLDDYDATIARLVTDIDGAQHHIRVVVYIFADDASGRRVIDALARAVKRGVVCHVLVDAVGSHPWIRSVLQRLDDTGVAARAALPFHLLRGRTRRDMRNHRKLFVIDGAIGYAGSQNIVDRDFKPGITNRELVARVTGPVVAEMNALFLSDWFLETEELLEDEPTIPEPTGAATLQILPSGADYPLGGFQTLLVWQVGQAREEVVIVTPYLIPDEDLLAAMATAVLRGVAVHVVVSAVADQVLVSLAQASYYDELLACGVHIHRYRDYLLHAKNVRIDDRLGVLGSSNVDIRSFQLNAEVSLLLLDPDSIGMLAQVQLGYLSACDEIDLVEWRRRSRWRKFAENAARLISPLL